MDPTGFAIGMLFVGAVIIGIVLIPGLIANKRKHPYKGVIWALSIIGLITGGLGWIAALVWALWPQEKSFIDPIVGNTYAKQKTHGESNLASKLSELDALLAQGQITKDEYDVIRKRALEN